MIKWEDFWLGMLVSFLLSLAIVAPITATINNSIWRNAIVDNQEYIKAVRDEVLAIRHVQQVERH